MAKTGRPTKYKKAYCDKVVELAREGMGREEICYELDICFQTLRNWEEAHPEFLEATTRAREMSLGWWMKQGRKGVWSREFNAPAYKHQVNNRFRDMFTDRSEVAVKDETLTDEQRAERVAALLDRARARRDREASEGGTADVS